MIYGIKFVIAILLVLATIANAFRMQAAGRNDFSLRMALKDFREELAKTASNIAAPGTSQYAPTHCVPTLLQP